MNVCAKAGEAMRTSAERTRGRSPFRKAGRSHRDKGEWGRGDDVSPESQFHTVVEMVSERALIGFTHRVYSTSGQQEGLTL